MQSSYEKFIRPIRSYVKREGRLTSGQDRALATLWTAYGVELQEKQCYDLFSECSPMVLEIGFGNGESLLELAKTNSHIQYFGAEVHRPGVGHLLLKLHENEITNVNVFIEDGVRVLRGFFPDGSLSKINLFFPDPWPKKKHHKRRLVQKEFIYLVASKLKVGGFFHFATDWQDYAEYALRVLNHDTNLVNCAQSKGFMPKSDGRPLTKFEKRAQQLGQRVFDIVMRKYSA